VTRETLILVRTTNIWLVVPTLLTISSTSAPAALSILHIDLIWRIVLWTSYVLANCKRIRAECHPRRNDTVYSFPSNRIPYMAKHVVTIPPNWIANHWNH
jgi:hypothetical protein